MKKIILSVLGLIVVGLAILGILGNEMREVKTEIQISAPPSVVWDILVDVEKWAEWSPIIKASSGNTALNSVVDITMISEEGKEGKDGPRYSPVITGFDAPKRFSWRAKMLGGVIFTNEKVFELEESGAGTKLVHKELFSGLMVPMMWGKVNESVPGMLNLMNQGLKARAENL